MSDHFFFDLNPNWWSRKYEYLWASGFARANDVCLDAACGVSHPFKFFLLDHCKEVHASDIDKRLLSRDEVLKEIKDNFGTNAYLDEKYLTNIRYSVAPLTKLPYSDGFFDMIYCISVLEHLKDYFNRQKEHKYVHFDCLSFKLHKKDIFKSFQEFKRVLKPGGLIVITFDYPTINLNYFKNIVQQLDLKFVIEPDYNLPIDAVYSDKFKLYCFRSVLTKK